MRQYLKECRESLILEFYLDEKAISEELRSYMEELARLTPKLTVRKSTEGAEHVPLVRVLRSDGSATWSRLPRGTGADTNLLLSWGFITLPDRDRLLTGKLWAE